MKKNDDSEFSFKTSKKSSKKNNDTPYTIQEALLKFDELKKIALSCLDKNGNPNISAAMRAVENKAKVAGLYSSNKTNSQTVVKMSEIQIDGKQLKLNIGEEYF